MPDSGKDLGADLHALWLAGREKLPTVAGQYRQAYEFVAETNRGLISAFHRPAQFGGGAYGPAYAHWMALRDELEAILRDTATNLGLAGEALLLAAKEYAQTDQAAADEFNRLLQVDRDFQRELARGGGR